MSIPEPPERKFLNLQNENNEAKGDRISVMSYNILKASTKRPDVPTEYLDWNRRKSLILKELLKYDVDVMCLQEVESGVFENFLMANLSSNGYDGICMQEPKRPSKISQGAAIFWKREKMTLKSQHKIDFQEDSRKLKELSGNSDLWERMTDKHQIALTAVLEIKDHSTTLVVCNPHLYSQPAFSDAKIIQCLMLLNHISTVNQTLENSGILLIGDFNSLPDSAVYQYVTEGHISTEHPQLGDFKRETAFLRKLVPEKSTNSNLFEHEMNLKSAYPPDTIPYTNFTRSFVGLLDYIFYSSEKFRCLKILGGLDESWVEDNDIDGFPHEHVPSDHLSLVAEFQLN